MEIQPIQQKSSLFDQRCDIKNGNRHISNVRYYTGLSAVIMKLLGKAVDLHDDATHKTYCVSVNSFEDSSKMAGLTPGEVSILVSQVAQNDAEIRCQPFLGKALGEISQKMVSTFGAPGLTLANLATQEFRDILGYDFDPENPEDLRKLQGISPWEFLKNRYKATTDEALIEVLMAHSTRRAAEFRENRRVLYGAPDDRTALLLESYFRHRFGPLFDPADKVQLEGKTPFEFVCFQHPGKDEAQIITILESRLPRKVVRQAKE